VTSIDTIIKQTSKLNLLYVEDNEMARISTLELLHEFFGEIIVAENGEEGLAKFWEHEIDLVITDINMPKMNGLEMIEVIHKANPDVVAIVLTAHSEQDYLKKSIRLGVRGYLNKPIELDNLVDVLHGAISEALLNAEKTRNMRAKERYNHYLQSIINSIQDPIMVIDRDFKIKVLNDFPLRNPDAPHVHPVDTCYGLLHDLDAPCDPNVRQCPLKIIEQTRESLTVIHECRNGDTPTKYEILATPLLGEDDQFTGIVGTARNITHHMSAQERLEAQKRELGHKVRHDDLTQLANRLFFDETFEHAVRMANSHQNGIAILFIDLNEFKIINDTMGHRAGDLVLQGISHAMQQAVRKGDTLARIGGDEFALIATDIGRDDESLTIANKILAAIEQPLEIEGETIRLSASIGIAHYPRDGSDIETLLKKSDSAMYQAKNTPGHIALHTS
jgi:diguanylate cyclase (GGDEF)-like protein